MDLSRANLNEEQDIEGLEPNRLDREKVGGQNLVFVVGQQLSPTTAIFTRSFDAVFAAVGIDTLLTPFQAPNANAFAERWVRSVRQECLDHLLIVNEWHLRRVLSAYVSHYNAERPHHSLAQQTPVP